MGCSGFRRSPLCFADWEVQSQVFIGSAPPAALESGCPFQTSALCGLGQVASVRFVAAAREKTAPQFISGVVVRFIKVQ